MHVSNQRCYEIAIIENFRHSTINKAQPDNFEQFWNYIVVRTIQLRCIRTFPEKNTVAGETHHTMKI